MGIAPAETAALWVKMVASMGGHRLVVALNVLGVSRIDLACWTLGGGVRRFARGHSVADLRTSRGYCRSPGTISALTISSGHRLQI